MDILSDLKKSNIYVLFEIIKEKSQMLNLPIQERKKLIGFGKFHDFYMFYITFSNDEKAWMFSARKKYMKSREDNLHKIILNFENEKEIINTIDDIYNSYLELKDTYEENDTNNTIGKSKKTEEKDEVFTTYVNKLDHILEKVREKIIKDGDHAIPYKFLSNRVKNRFLERKIYTFKELSNYSGCDIYNWAWCGRNTIRAIIHLMEKYVSDSIEVEEIVNNSSESTYMFDDSLIARIENIVLSHYYENDNLKNDIIDDLYYLGKNLISIIDEVISLMDIDYDVLEILKEYVYNENTTLQSIGEKNQLSRERIRQIINKLKVKIMRCYKSKSMNIYQLKVKNIFDKIGDNQIIDFVSYGLLLDNSERKIKFILSVIFQSEVLAENITSIAIENMKFNDEKEDKFNLLEKASFPGEKRRDLNLNELESTVEVETFEYIKSIKNKLIKLNQIDKIIDRPNICFYKSINNMYYPHFLVKLKTGEVILILVFPTISLAKYYNKELFNSLHSYCQKYNIGYIIMNENFKTIFDIKNIVLDTQLITEMENILNEKKCINWADIQKIKRKYKLTEEMMVGFILKNNLYFNLKPFVIKKT